MNRTAWIFAACLAAATPAAAQDIQVPGRQVIEDNDVLLEVVYTSSRVRLRVFDLDGQPIDLSNLWIKRCSVDVIALRGETRASRSAKVARVVPEQGLPYLEARHQLGPLHEQDRLEVNVKLKNLLGRGDVNDRFRVAWERVVDYGLICRMYGPTCRRSADVECSLCRHRLCRPLE